MRKLSGLISLWMKFLLWMYSILEINWSANNKTVFRLNRLQWWFMKLMLLKNTRAGINLFSNDEINVRQCQSRTCCRSWRDPPGSDQVTPSPSHCSHLRLSSSIFPSKTRKSYKRLKQLTFWAAPLDCRNAYSALNMHLFYNCVWFCICNCN